MALPPRTCCLDHCSVNHRGADCGYSCCDAAVGTFADDTSDPVSVHANINTTNADPVAHVTLSVNAAEGNFSPTVARQTGAAMIAAADLAEAGARRKPAA